MALTGRVKWAGDHIHVGVVKFAKHGTNFVVAQSHVRRFHHNYQLDLPEYICFVSFQAIPQVLSHETNS